MKKSYVPVLGFVVIIIVISSFTRIGGTKNPDQQSKEVSKTKIGVIVPLSGPAGAIGEEVKNSVDLPDLKNVERLYEDDQCDAKKALSAYQKLKAEGVDIFYLACSGSVMSIAPLAKENGDLILTAYAGSSEIRKTGTEVIRFVPDASSVVGEMNAYLTQDKAKKYAVFYENLDYPKSALDSLKQKLGDQIVFAEGYNGDGMSFKSQLLKFKGKDIDGIIMIPVSDKAARIIMKEMQQQKIIGDGMRIIGDVNLCDYAFKPSEFGLHGLCWKAGVSNSGFDAFAAEYKARFGVEAEYPFYSAITYDVMLVLSDIISKANNATPQVIIAELLKGQKGRIAEYQFDEGGEVTNAGKYLEKVEF